MAFGLRHHWTKHEPPAPVIVVAPTPPSPPPPPPPAPVPPPEPVSPPEPISITSADDRWSAPSITTDGSRIVVPWSGEDGARGAENLAIAVFDHAGRVRKQQVVETAGQCRGPECSPDVEAQVAQQIAAAKRMLDEELRDKPLHAMVHVNRNPESEAEAQLVVEGLTVDLSPTGTLTIKPHGHAPVSRHDDAWRSEPTAARARELQVALDRGDVPCFNAARLGDAWIDLPRRAVVIQISYRGNDSCWEPDSVPVVMTW